MGLLPSCFFVDKGSGQQNSGGKQKDPHGDPDAGRLRKGTDDDYNIIFHSLYNSMGPHDCFTEMVPLPWASFESMLGILLIGFLGFIIANNIRNDS
jgi:hypothetical protein